MKKIEKEHGIYKAGGMFALKRIHTNEVVLKEINISRAKMNSRGNILRMTVFC